MKTRHKDQTLLCSDLYEKIPVEMSRKSIHLLPQFNSFILVRDDKNVFGCNNDSVVNPFRMIERAPDQLLSHFSIKSTTSSIIPSNSLMILRNSSEFGSSLSLVSWSARTLMPSARFCIASRDSFWASKCYKTYQAYCSSWKRMWPTLYTISMQSTTVWTTEFSCFKSDNIHAC